MMTEPRQPGDLSPDEWSALAKYITKRESAKIRVLLADREVGRPARVEELLYEVPQCREAYTAKISAGNEAAASLGELRDTLAFLNQGKALTEDDAAKLAKSKADVKQKISAAEQAEAVGHDAAYRVKWINEQFGPLFGLAEPKVCHGSCPNELLPHFRDLGVDPYVLGSWRHADQPTIQRPPSRLRAVDNFYPRKEST